MKKEITAELLERLYLKEGKTYAQIAQVLKIPEGSVSKALRKHGIPTRKKYGARKIKMSISDEELKEKIERGVKLSSIARMLGVKLSTVSLRAKGIGASSKKNSTEWEKTAITQKRETIWDVFDDEFEQERKFRYAQKRKGRGAIK